MGTKIGIENIVSAWLQQNGWQLHYANNRVEPLYVKNTDAVASALGYDLHQAAAMELAFQHIRNEDDGR